MISLELVSVLDQYVDVHVFELINPIRFHKIVFELF